MPLIVTTIFDPDAANLLPAKWGKDYQVDAIDRVYLNGQKGFLLHLSPLQNPNIETFVQGCRPIELNVRTDYPYYYLLCAASPIPPAIGSAWGEYYRVSECRKVLRKTYTNFESGCHEHWHWRLTLATRREPINLLPPAQKEIVSSFFEFQLTDIKAALVEAEIEFKIKPRKGGFDLFVDECNHDIATSLVWNVEQHQISSGKYK